MRIVGRDFNGHVQLRGNVVNRADRALASFVGKTMQDVLGCAVKFEWRLELFAEDCRQLVGDGPPPQSSQPPLPPSPAA